MPTNKYTPAIQNLESQGQFDQNVCPINARYVKPLDPTTFSYQPRTIWGRLYGVFVRSVVWLLGGIVCFFGFDLRVRGRYHLRAIKKTGAIIVTNHTNILDPLNIRQIARQRRMDYLVAAYNHKTGLGGITLRAGGAMPLGDNLQMAKKLDAAIADILQRRHLLTIYAESTMWPGYQKIRPLKRGAFYYAVKNNVPVLPVVTLYRRTNWLDRLVGRRYKITLTILPAIFPDQTKDRPTAIATMQTQCHQAMIAAATMFYNENADATNKIQETPSQNASAAL